MDSLIYPFKSYCSEIKFVYSQDTCMLKLPWRTHPSAPFSSRDMALLEASVGDSLKTSSFIHKMRL
jgi:hypothetical protein